MHFCTPVKSHLHFFDHLIMAPADTAGSSPDRMVANEGDAVGSKNTLISVTKEREKGEVDFRCRRCLTTLASSVNVVPHYDQPAAVPHDDPENQAEGLASCSTSAEGSLHQARDLGGPATQRPSTCSAVFVEPLRWMFSKSKCVALCLLVLVGCSCRLFWHASETLVRLLCPSRV